MKHKKSKAYIVAVLTAGWLCPVGLGFSSLQAYFQYTIMPQITGKGPKTSLNYLILSDWWFAVAAIWLALVIMCWTLFFLNTRSRD
jgi:hypothetical protein